MEYIEATFAARDEHGTQYVINVVQNFRAGADDGMEKDQLKELRTTDGQPVNFIEPGRYEIICGMLRIPVTSDDPAAPQS